MCIKNADGNWEEDVDRVREIFEDGFSSLYCAKQSSSSRVPKCIYVWGNRLFESEAFN